MVFLSCKVVAQAVPRRQKLEYGRVGAVHQGAAGLQATPRLQVHSLRHVHCEHFMIIATYNIVVAVVASTTLHIRCESEIGFARS